MLKLEVREIILVSLFSALIAISAFIKIPFYIVPFTLQTMAVLLSALLLGAKLSAFSVIVYIALGLAGFPVFARGSGIGYVLSPTFGYLVGFVIAVILIGKFAGPYAGASLMKKIVVCCLGILVISAFGISHWYVISNYVLNNPTGFWHIIWYGMLIFLPKDFAFCVVCALISERMSLKTRYS